MSTNDPIPQERLDAIKVRADSVTTLRTASFNDWQELALHLSEDADTLITEVERLRALTTVDEDMVERAALVLGNRRHRGIHRGWSGATSAARDGWRDEARAALDAALNPGEGS